VLIEFSYVVILLKEIINQKWKMYCLIFCLLQNEGLLGKKTPLADFLGKDFPSSPLVVITNVSNDEDEDDHDDLVNEGTIKAIALF